MACQAAADSTEKGAHSCESGVIAALVTKGNNAVKEAMSSEQKASFTEHVSKADDELYPRVVASNPELGQPEYASNYVVTTKYTLLTFLPFSLFAQFRRLANCYFLLIAILQSIPEISPLSPYTAIAPLVFVVGLSMIREALEDFNRYQSDKGASPLR